MAPGRQRWERRAGACVRAQLAPGGVLLLVHSSRCGIEESCQAVRQAGLRTEVAVRRRIPFGPLVSARADWFEERGLVAPGVRHEELVVIRGVRSE